MFFLNSFFDINITICILLLALFSLMHYVFVIFLKKSFMGHFILGLPFVNNIYYSDFCGENRNHLMCFKWKRT